MPGPNPPGPDPKPNPEPDPVVPVPEIRDYARVNAELVRLLDAGHARVRLAGAEGQRLLAFGLKGPWRAVVEVQGDAGPELAGELDAPGLLIACAGSAADGAGRGLKAGRLAIGGEAGEAVGYAQTGGAIVVAGGAGPRAGLDQSGGLLLVLGPVGRLAGERQSGGRLIVGGAIGPHASRGRRAGQLLALARMDPADLAALSEEARAFGPGWTAALAQARRGS